MSAPPAARERKLFADAIRERVATVVVGQEKVVERLLIALLTGGHILLIGVPGLAKTLLVNALAKAIALRFSRIQFTIDMLPSDIVGSEVLLPNSSGFQTQLGPVFTNILLADEINRAAPKVQSALLEAMQERRVTIGKETHALPTPFLVIATQNPVEQAGTFELPEAQLDRFMLCHRLVYPSLAEEEEVLRRQLALGLKKTELGAIPRSAFDAIAEEPCASAGELVEAMEAVQAVHVSEVFLKHCVALVDASRRHTDLELGCSPRAALALVQASRARAFLLGRDYTVPEDLFALAPDVVLHRIRLRYESVAAGKTPARVLEELFNALV